MGRLSVLLSSIFFAAPAFAATPGFEQDFTTDAGGFGAGSVVTRVTSGGVGGASDPYIAISNASPSNLASFSSDPRLVGNLPADGVTGFSFWLRDVGANDNHQIHVGIGAGMGTPVVNFWLSVPGFTPPDGSWQQFTVDLTDPSQWVQIIGTGTFQAALASSDRILFRHDVPPLVMNPDPAAGDFGLDRIQVLPVPSVPTVSAPGEAVLGMLLVALAGVMIHRRQRPDLAPSP